MHKSKSKSSAAAGARPHLEQAVLAQGVGSRGVKVGECEEQTGHVYRVVVLGEGPAPVARHAHKRDTQEKLMNIKRETKK